MLILKERESGLWITPRLVLGLAMLLKLWYVPFAP
jgi:hypothetical protein